MTPRRWLILPSARPSYKSSNQPSTLAVLGPTFAYGGSSATETLQLNSPTARGGHHARATCYDHISGPRFGPRATTAHASTSSGRGMTNHYLSGLKLHKHLLRTLSGFSRESFPARFVGRHAPQSRHVNMSDTRGIRRL